MDDDFEIFIRKMRQNAHLEKIMTRVEWILQFFAILAWGLFVLIVAVDQRLIIIETLTIPHPPYLIDVVGIVTWCITITAWSTPYVLWFIHSVAQSRIKQIQREEFIDFWDSCHHLLKLEYSREDFERQLDHVFNDVDLLSVMLPRWKNTQPIIFIQRIWWVFSNPDLVREEYDRALLEAHFNSNRNNNNISDVENDASNLMILLAWCFGFYKESELNEIRLGCYIFRPSGVTVLYDGHNLPPYKHFVRWVVEHKTGYYADCPIEKWDDVHHPISCPINEQWDRLNEYLSGHNCVKLPPVDKLRYILTGELPQ